MIRGFFSRFFSRGPHTEHHSILFYLESWLKDDSGYIPEYFIRFSGVLWARAQKKEPRTLKIDDPQPKKIKKKANLLSLQTSEWLS